MALKEIIKVVFHVFNIHYLNRYTTPTSVQSRHFLILNRGYSIFRRQDTKYKMKKKILIICLSASIHKTVNSFRQNPWHFSILYSSQHAVSKTTPHTTKQKYAPENKIFMDNQSEEKFINLNCPLKVLSEENR